MAEDPLLFMESNPQVGRERNTMSPDHEIENLGGSSRALQRSSLDGKIQLEYKKF